MNPALDLWRQCKGTDCYFCFSQIYSVLLSETGTTLQFSFLSSPANRLFSDERKYNKEI